MFLVKIVMSPYNWVIYPLTQPQVANQQQQKKSFIYTFAIIHKWRQTNS